MSAPENLNAQQFSGAEIPPPSREAQLEEYRRFQTTMHASAYPVHSTTDLVTMEDAGRIHEAARNQAADVKAGTYRSTRGYVSSRRAEEPAAQFPTIVTQADPNYAEDTANAARSNDAIGGWLAKNKPGRSAEEARMSPRKRVPEGESSSAEKNYQEIAGRVGKQAMGFKERTRQLADMSGTTEDELMHKRAQGVMASRGAEHEDVDTTIARMKQRKVDQYVKARKGAG